MANLGVFERYADDGPNRYLRPIGWEVVYAASFSDPFGRNRRTLRCTKGCGTVHDVTDVKLIHSTIHELLQCPCVEVERRERAWREHFGDLCELWA